MKNKPMFITGIALLLSFFSVYTVSNGWGEPYPFFHFKLYSRPHGMNGEADAIGIYVNDNIRINSQPSALYDTDELNYALNYLLPDALANRKNAVNKLKLLLQSAYPGYPAYQIVQEKYTIPAYATGNTACTKKILLSIP